RRRRCGGKEKEHLRVVEEVAGLGDGELGWCAEAEANGLAVPGGAQAEPPGLNIHAFVPEAWIGGGDGDGDGLGDIKADVLVTGGSVGHAYRLAIYRDGEGGGMQFLG